MRHRRVTKADPKFASIHPVEGEDVLFQSIDEFMTANQDGGQIPVLYSIHHAVFDYYPYDTDVLEFEDTTLETMKEAYRHLRIADIYAQRVDWMMSNDDSEDTVQERLQAEFQAFEKEFQTKDWRTLDRDE